MQARTDYDRAARMRTTLEARPENARSKAEYEKVIAAFRSVYRTNPTYIKAPMALEAVAELYEEMGRRFSDSPSFHTSIGAYEFLIKRYPRSSYSREGLLAIGEIYRTDLSDPAQAQKTFREFLKLYPSSEKSAEVRAALKDSQQIPAGGDAKRSAFRGASEIEPGDAKTFHPGGTQEVTSIRRWVGPNYTRIVIAVDGEVGFDTSRLVSPDRLVFDLSNARPSPELMGKTFPFEDGFLRQIRVALYKPTVTRVVLDVARIEDYSVFPLPNPFRLVIDIHGPPGQLTAKVTPAKPPLPEGAAARVAESTTEKNAHTGDQTLVAGTHNDSADTTGEIDGPQTGLISEATTPVGKPKTSKGKKQRAALSGDSNPPIMTPPPTEDGSRTLTRALGLKIGRIVIDPGHGGHDTGTIGPTGLTEKDVVLDVALRLAKLLEEEAGSEVVMTRHDDTFIPLEERTAIANEKAADLFISIHANASRAVIELEGDHIYSRLVKAGGKQKDRGVKKAPFVVLIGANMPSVLAEISFLTNPKDEHMLRQPEYRQKIAQALYQGVIRYVNNLGGVRVAQEDHARRRTSEPEAPVETTARQLSPSNAPNF